MEFKIWSRTEEYQDLSRIKPKPLVQLFQEWLMARGDQAMPRQREFRPANFQQSIGNVALVGLQDDPISARYLFVGPRLKRLLGKDPTRKTIEAVYPPSVAREVYAAFGKVVRSRKPTFYKRDFVVLNKSFGYFRLLLPLRLDDDRVRRIAVGIYPTDVRLSEARTWQSAAVDFYRRRDKTADASAEAISDAWENTLRD